MKKLFLKTILGFVILLFVTTDSHAQLRKPNMKRIYSTAAKAFEKAKAEGKVQKVGQETKLNTRGAVLDYKQLPADMRVPGQFEESQAVIMTWRYSFDTINKYPILSDTGLIGLGKVSADLAFAIQQNAKAIIRISAAKDSTDIKNYMIARGTPLTNYSFYVHGVDDWWDRDSGPISFYYGDQDSIGMVDMDYYTVAALKDSAGNVFTDFKAINEGGRLFDDSIPLRISEKLGYPLYRTPLNDEGGNIISDGLNTIWGSDGTRRNNTEASSFGFSENTSLLIYSNYPLTTQAEFDTLFKKSFGLKGHVETKVFSCDGGTGHIDIFGKLIDENNFALVDYSKAVNHPDYGLWNENLKMFQTLKDFHGKPITIRLLPMPLIASGAIQTECDTAIILQERRSDQRTYVNGIFVNKSYIMPVQSDPKNLIPSDVAAIADFKKAMPGYKIIPVDASSMFGTGGAIHCITMQIPAENPIFIRHGAITGSQTLKANFTVNAMIKNKSGLASQFVFYRKSTSSTWIAQPMTALSNNNYTANIPTTDFAKGDIIHYFIEATSKNGKTISKPFVAREGGYHVFTVGSTVSVENLNDETNFTLAAYPNPTDGGFTLPISVDDSRNVTIDILDMLGRVVHIEKDKLPKGLHLKSLNLGNKSGVYIVRTIIDNVVSKTQKLMIK